METFEIDNVKFTLVGRVLAMKKIAVVEITNPKTVVEFEKNCTLHDVRLGAFRNVRCGTCGNNAIDCPGHFGYISLSAPVLNPVLVKYNLKKILDSTCFRCFTVHGCSCVASCSPNSPDSPASKKRKIVKPLKIKINQRVPYTTKNVGVKNSFQDSEDNHITLMELNRLISKVPAQEYRKLFPEPLQSEVDLTDFCFLHVLLVLPTQSRPPNFSGGSWKLDSISRLYLDVLKASSTYRMKCGIVEKDLLDEYHQRIQSAVDILFDTNNTSRNINSTISLAGGIRQRIDGKGGRLRQNLMGKRVEFSARTVLSGDPKLGINEVGVPQQIADDLTVPVTINRYNKHMTSQWKIKYVQKASGQRFDTKINKNFRQHLQEGDVVERTLMEGDVVAVNRQPTLHRGSVIACYVKIFPSKTFRLNYTSMITLNADTGKFSLPPAPRAPQPTNDSFYRRRRNKHSRSPGSQIEGRTGGIDVGVYQHRMLPGLQTTNGLFPGFPPRLLSTFTRHEITQKRHDVHTVRHGIRL